MRRVTCAEATRHRAPSLRLAFLDLLAGLEGGGPQLLIARSCRPSAQPKPGLSSSPGRSAGLKTINEKRKLGADPKKSNQQAKRQTKGNCQMVRSRQPMGVLISVVYLFGGEESKAKNSKVAHEYVEHRELRTMCGSRTGGWSLPCVMSD
jgi:hypothetical protein